VELEVHRVAQDAAIDSDDTVARLQPDPVRDAVGSHTNDEATLIFAACARTPIDLSHALRPDHPQVRLDVRWRDILRAGLAECAPLLIAEAPQQPL
jgi:hypothetical protein